MQQIEYKLLTKQGQKGYEMPRIWQNQLEQINRKLQYVNSMSICTEAYISYSQQCVIYLPDIILYFQNLDNINEMKFKQYYNGQIKNNMANGNGFVLNRDLTSYEGEFKNNQFHGQGILTKSDGFKYQGFFANGKPEGKGNEQWPNGNTYIGDYSLGKKQGNGILTYHEGEYYEGKFSENKFNGKGFYQWSDGRNYEGEFLNNKMHGFGEFNWPENNIKYKGYFKEDMKSGYGELLFPNDTIIICHNWLQGEIEGEAEIIFEGEKIKGLWKNGQRVKWLNNSNGKKILERVFEMKNQNQVSNQNDLQLTTDFSRSQQNFEMKIFQQNNQDALNTSNLLRQPLLDSYMQKTSKKNQFFSIELSKINNLDKVQFQTYQELYENNKEDEFIKNLKKTNNKIIQQIIFTLQAENTKFKNNIQIKSQVNSTKSILEFNEQVKIIRNQQINYKSELALSKFLDQYLNNQ